METFTLNSSASPSLRDFVDALIPYGNKTPEGSKLRRVGFSKADTNATGQVSLAETEGFLLSILNDDDDNDNDDNEGIFRAYRPSFRQAFNNAKLLQKSNGKILKGAKSATSDDYISFPEFRVFTIYLQIYAAMFDIFSSIDGRDEGIHAGDDARISLDEFLKGCQAADGHSHGYDFKGLKKLKSEDTAKQVFETIDSNNGGYILFSELSGYLKQEEIKAKTYLGTLLSGNVKPSSTATSNAARGVSRKGSRRSISTSRHRTSTGSRKYSPASVTSRTSSSSRVSTRTSSKKSQMVMPPTISGAYTPSIIHASKEFKALVKSFQPYAEKTPAACLALRKNAFSWCDVNGTGQCSLAEIDSFIHSVLKQNYGPQKGTKVFKAFRPSFLVAYNGAKNFKNNASGSDDDDYITFSEFRMFNVYLCVYAGMLDSFSRVDGGGTGTGTGVDSNSYDDRRVTMAEWMDGYSKFGSSGFTALQSLDTSDAAVSAFKEMDADGHGTGIVRYSEFCAWIAAAEVAEFTALGELLEGSIDIPVTTNTSSEDVSIQDDALPPPPQDIPVEEQHLSQEIEPEVEDEKEPLEEVVNNNMSEPDVSGEGKWWKDDQTEAQSKNIEREILNAELLATSNADEGVDQPMHKIEVNWTYLIEMEDNPIAQVPYEKEEKEEIQPLANADVDEGVDQPMHEIEENWTYLIEMEDNPIAQVPYEKEETEEILIAEPLVNVDEPMHEMEENWTYLIEMSKLPPPVNPQNAIDAQ